MTEYTDPVALRIPRLAAPLELFVHGPEDAVVSRSIRENGIWEPFETSLVLALLRPGASFVDVGANIGYFSLLAAAAVGETGRVLAFEPDPDNFRLLMRSAAHNGLQARIHATCAGLAEEDRAGRLYLSRDNLGDHQIFPDSDARPSLPVQLYNGSRYLAHRLQRLDLLKVDTQGAEYAVMAGLLPLLGRLPGEARILIELTPYSLGRAGASGRRLIELLAGLDRPFWIVDHIEHRLVASSADELARWCDGVDAVSGDQGFMNILVGAGP